MNYKDHRSIRSFLPKEVASNLLTEILTIGTRASNTGNFQSYSVVVTQEQAMKEKLAPFHFNQPMATQAPVLLTFCVDYNRLATWCDARDTECGHLNLMGFYNGTLDAMLFAQNVAVAAEENGLGYCFLGTVLYNLEGIIQTLALPRGVMPVLTMALGYPAENPPLRVRLPLEAIVHHEKYTPFAAEKVETLYRDVENDPFYREQVKKAGRENLAQLIMEQQYPSATYEKLSAELTRVLVQQGYTVD